MRARFACYGMCLLGMALGFVPSARAVVVTTIVKKTPSKEIAFIPGKTGRASFRGTSDIFSDSLSLSNADLPKGFKINAVNEADAIITVTSKVSSEGSYNCGGCVDYDSDPYDADQWDISYGGSLQIDDGSRKWMVDLPEGDVPDISHQRWRSGRAYGDLAISSEPTVIPISSLDASRQSFSADMQFTAFGSALHGPVPARLDDPAAEVEYSLTAVWEVSSLTFKEAIANSIEVLPTSDGCPSANECAIAGKFKPLFGLSLNDVAEMSGQLEKEIGDPFVSFNWLQTIEEWGYYDDAGIFRNQPALYAEIFGGDLPAFDPTKGPLYPKEDDFPWYWNSGDIGEWTFADSFFIYDSPSFAGLPEIDQVWSVKFLTQLVGVRADNSWVEISSLFPDLDLDFGWRYTQKGPCDHCGDSGPLKNTDPALSGGGTVEFLGFVRPSANTVPEPSTWTTLIFGFGIVGASLRRRKSPILVVIS